MTSRTQQHRAETTNTPPAANSLAPGELYVELADPVKLWAGVPTTLNPNGSKIIFDSSGPGGSEALNKTGDTATGTINFAAGININSTPATAPNAAQDDNTNKIATTSFVLGQGGNANPSMDAATPIPGTSPRYSRQDHVHPTDTSRAPLNSPTFTGTPLLTNTPPVDDNTLKIADTAYVIGQAGAATPLMDGAATPGTSTRWARQDHVHPPDTTRGKVVVSDTPPASPSPGDFWFDSVGVQLYLYYQDPTGSQFVPANNQTLGLATLQNQVNALANPNKLINPFLEIDQANEGAAVNATNLAPYVVDGFRSTSTLSASGTLAVGRLAVPTAPFAGYCASVTMGTAQTSVPAGDQIQLTHSLEADDINDTLFGTAVAKPLTLSFWAWCTLSGTYYISIRNGATSNRCYIIPYTITTASIWQLFSFTIPGDMAGTWALTGNTSAMTVAWVLGSGSNYQISTPNSWQAGGNIGIVGMSNAFMQTGGASFRLGPVKLEVGSTATPMLRQSFQSELQRCQRYYEKSYDIGTALGTVSSGSGLMAYQNNLSGANSAGTINVIYKTTKRAVPTVTFYSPATGAAGKLRDGYLGVDVTPTVQPGSTTQVAVYGITSQSGGVQMNCHYVADARL